MGEQTLEPVIFNLEDVQAALGPDAWPADDMRLQLRYLRVMSLQARRLEKRGAAEFIGSPRVTSLLQHFLPIVQQPLMEIYSAGDLGGVWHDARPGVEAGLPALTRPRITSHVPARIMFRITSPVCSSSNKRSMCSKQ